MSKPLPKRLFLIYNKYNLNYLGFVIMSVKFPVPNVLVSIRKDKKLIAKQEQTTHKFLEQIKRNISPVKFKNLIKKLESNNSYNFVIDKHSYLIKPILPRVSKLYDYF